MDGRAALWTLVGIFVVFKLATTAMIIAADPNGLEITLALFLAFHWPFIALGLAVGIVVLAASAPFWVRLLRMRARRKELQAAEWRVD